MAAPEWVSYAALGVSAGSLLIAGGGFATGRSALKASRRSASASERSSATAQQALQLSGHAVRLLAIVLYDKATRAPMPEVAIAVVNSGRGEVDLDAFYLNYLGTETRSVYHFDDELELKDASLPVRLPGGATRSFHLSIAGALGTVGYYKQRGEPAPTSFILGARLGNGEHVEELEPHALTADWIEDDEHSAG